MAVMNAQTERFAEIVRSRRQQLGLRQDQLSPLGGPSSTTMTKIENAELDQPARVTLRKLDAGLKWEPGSAQRALAGGEPKEIEDIPARPAVRSMDDSELSSLAIEIVTELQRRAATDDPRQIAPGSADDVFPDFGAGNHPDRRAWSR